MIHITSDIHFSHTNIINYCNRPFTDTSHMNEVLINNWNSVVGPDDVVYCLGDMLMGRLEDSKPCFLRLQGTIHLCAGNHDEKALRFSWFRERFASIQDSMILEYEGKKIVLNHYFNPAMLEKGDILFHGHSHTQGRSTESKRSLDIGVDAAAALLGSYRPFTIDEAISFCVPLAER
jgi:calcineurin-like phosphoesterase family protein